MLARPCRAAGIRPVLSATLGLAYLLLQTRVIFHGADIGWEQSFLLGEKGVEICILLVCALATTVLFPRAAPVVLAAKILAGMAFVYAAVGLGVLVNPLVSGESIGGGAFGTFCSSAMQRRRPSARRSPISRAGLQTIAKTLGQGRAASGSRQFTAFVAE